MKQAFLKSLFCCTLWLFTAHLAQATVDEAYDHTMEAAIPYVEKGYTVRQDYWNGEVESGQKLALRHQLFKGNDYVFWLGTANEDCKIELSVFDSKGQPVHMEKEESAFTNTVRVNPPHTGTYTIVFSITSKKERGVTWAISYGYR
jgi:hypothetical protein